MENWKAIVKSEGFENEEQMLKYLYYKDLLSLSQIGKRFDVTKFCIFYRMRKYELKRRKVGYGKSNVRKRGEEKWEK
jgi:hypothetical protein